MKDQPKTSNNKRETCCKWPDGTERIVIVGSANDDGKVRVGWNEQHAPMGELGCVAGLDDEVPKEWLRSVTSAEARKIEAQYWKVRDLSEPPDPADWWKTQG